MPTAYYTVAGNGSPDEMVPGPSFNIDFPNYFVTGMKSEPEGVQVISKRFFYQDGTNVITPSWTPLGYGSNNGHEWVKKVTNR